MIEKAYIEALWRRALIDQDYADEMGQFCALIDTPLTASMDSLSALPGLFCVHYGGDFQQVLPLVSAWDVLRYAARILDDIVDGDTPLLGKPFQTRLNASTGLIFTAGLALNDLEACGASAGTARDIRHTFYEAALQICSGQHLNLVLETPTLEEWWQIATAKSGLFLGLICWAGTRLATAAAQPLALAREFGQQVGILDQIQDDLVDLWGREAEASDLKRPHNWGLAAAYAFSVLPEQKRAALAAHLRQAAVSPDQETAARQLIIESGARAYLVVQSTLYYQQAVKVVEKMALPADSHGHLLQVLDRMRLSG